MTMINTVKARGRMFLGIILGVIIFIVAFIIGGFAFMWDAFKNYITGVIFGIILYVILIGIRKVAPKRIASRM